MPGFAVEFTGPDGQADVSGIFLQPREYTFPDWHRELKNQKRKNQATTVL